MQGSERQVMEQKIGWSIEPAKSNTPILLLPNLCFRACVVLTVCDESVWKIVVTVILLLLLLLYLYSHMKVHGTSKINIY